jgi:hypothetical protein
MHVPADEVRREMEKAVTAQGAQNKVAADVGVHRQELNAFLRGGNRIPRKVLGWLGLEERKVYVAKKEAGDA